MTDTLYRGMALSESFRIFAVDATQTAQKARDLHDLSPIATILMGKMISAAALLSMDIKNENSEITLRIDGQGELKGGLVVCNEQGHVRGYLKNPKLFLDDPEDNFHPGRFLGEGSFNVIRQRPHAEPWIGSTELITGEVAEDLAHFYLQSEQIPSAVALGILIDKDAKIRACAGFMIQQLPMADAENAQKLIQNLENTPNLSDLMDMGISVLEVLKKFVFKDLDFQMQEYRKLRYQCSCSKEVFARSLLTLGLEELETMKEGITPMCHYCNAQYHFTASDIQELIKMLKEGKDAKSPA